jgi:hypothetical protein
MAPSLNFRERAAVISEPAGKVSPCRYCPFTVADRYDVG